MQQAVGCFKESGDTGSIIQNAFPDIGIHMGGDDMALLESFPLI